MLSGSIGVKSEELETKNLHSTHVLFSRDIAGYESSVSRFWDLEVILRIFAKILNTYEVLLPFKKNHTLIHDHFEFS